MAAERLSMRQIREILRQKWTLGRSHREVAEHLGAGLGTVSGVECLARAARLAWPQVEALSDEVFEARLWVTSDKHTPGVSRERLSCVTEYQLHTLGCARCGVTTTAPLPPGVPRGAFGPRRQARVAVCTGVYHLSRRTPVRLMADLFGVELALGSVSTCEAAVSDAVAGAVEEAHTYAQQQAVAHADETGWWERHQRAWL